MNHSEQFGGCNKASKDHECDCSLFCLACNCCINHCVCEVKAANMEEKKNEKPNHVTEEEKNTRLLDRAFAVIREHVDRGHRFSFDQMDIGIEISLPVLPKPEQELFKEIAQHNHVSLWQTIWAQFRRAHENGMSFSLLLDPGWQSGDIYSLSPEICEECGKTFTPERFKSRFCSNKCGAEEERK